MSHSCKTDQMPRHRTCWRIWCIEELQGVPTSRETWCQQNSGIHRPEHTWSKNKTKQKFTSENFFFFKWSLTKCIAALSTRAHSPILTLINLALKNKAMTIICLICLQLISFIINKQASLLILKVLFGNSQSFAPLLCCSLGGKHGSFDFWFFKLNINCNVLVALSAETTGVPEPSTVARNTPVWYPATIPTSKQLKGVELSFLSFFFPSDWPHLRSSGYKYKASLWLLFFLFVYTST